MSPFARWFGARVLRREGGEAELALEVREEFLQGHGLQRHRGLDSAQRPHVHCAAVRFLAALFFAPVGLLALFYQVLQFARHRQKVTHGKAP